MVATIELDMAAERPCVPLPPLEAFADSPSTLRLVDAPRVGGAWHIAAVRVTVAMPDGSEAGFAATADGDAWLVTIPGCATTGTVRGGWTVYADGVDERGVAFAALALGRGDVCILSSDGAITPGETAHYMRLVYGETRPASPREGDTWHGADGWEIYSGDAWIPLGGGGSGGTTDYNDLSNKPAIGGVTLSGDKTAEQLGLATSEQGTKADTAVQKAGDTMTGGLTVPNLTVGVRVTGSTVGRNSTAEGEYTTAGGDNSHAEGAYTTANGYNAHAEGGDTMANGYNAHAEGGDTMASGLNSHAEGGDTMASGLNSHAEGSGTVTLNEAEHAQGQYNASHTGTTAAEKTAHSIGIGNSDSDRKNAVETMQDGKTFIYGVGGYLGTNPNTATDLATEMNGKAPLASPAFTGTPTAPTPTADDNSTKIATTAFVDVKVRYDLLWTHTIDTAAVSSEVIEGETVTYAEVTASDRAANNIAIVVAIDELRVTLPDAVTYSDGTYKVRDFELAVQVGNEETGALTAPALVLVSPVAEVNGFVNPSGTMPKIAAGTATVPGYTLLYFSEIANGAFLVKGETVKEIIQ